MTSNRWISIFSAIFSALTIGAVGIMAVLATSFNYTNNSALIGVALTNIFKITGLLSFAIKVLSDTQLQMNAVERVKEYIDKEDLEKDWK